MKFLDAVRRTWAHRKLSRGQCEWCSAVLPDTGPVHPVWRGCSEECANKLWAQNA